MRGCCVVRSRAEGRSRSRAGPVRRAVPWWRSWAGTRRSSACVPATRRRSPAGCRPRSSARLATHGIATVAELANADLAVLVAEFGPRTGAGYADLGRGHGSAVVDDTPWVARGHGRERTFQRDLTEPEQVDEAIRQLVDQVLAD